MFFYLSFLRPPPRSSDATNPVSLTPQIANDLRTSYFDQPVEIFYAWSPSLLDFAGPSITSTARKLTTWRTSSRYKNLTIPLPPKAKSGQEWRLSLSATASSGNFVIDLCVKEVGASPLPVISMPIILEGKGGKSKLLIKQEQVERLYSISGIGSEKLLCIREQTSFDLDKKIWDSGLGLSSWVTNILLSTEQISDLSVQKLKSGLISLESNAVRIIELGTGTGIVSITLSTLLEHLCGSRHSQVLATDLPSAIELIDHNILTNKAMYASVELESLVLDWDEETLPSQALGPVDFIVMADVTYNTASFPSLVRTLDSLVKSSKASTGGRLPFVLLAYKQRDPAERTLWPMLCDIGIDLSLVDSVRGAGEEAVEIWLQTY